LIYNMNMYVNPKAIYVQGGLDPNKSIHSGVKFRHLVRVLKSPNEERVCNQSISLS